MTQRMRVVDSGGWNDGSIEWAEFELACEAYRERYGVAKTTLEIAEHPFTHKQLTDYLGYEPKTWWHQ